MMSQIGGKDGIDGERTEAMELLRIEVDRPPILRLQQKMPTHRAVVVLEDRAIVVKYRLG